MDVRIILLIGIFVIGIITVFSIDFLVEREVKIEPIIENKPNIIVIMTDDLSENMLNIALNNDLLPNLTKHIFNEGTNFTNSFVTFPLCCPTRATALSGQYSHNHGVLSTLSPLGGVAKFNDTHTIATVLQNDYHTGFVGKYLNGYGKTGEGVPAEYTPPGWDQWRSTIIYPNEVFKKSYGGMYKYLITINGNVSEVDGKYKTYTEGEHLVDLINNKPDDEPSLIFYWPRVPHTTGDGMSCNPSSDEGATRAKKSIKVPPEYDSILNNVTIPHSKSFNARDGYEEVQVYSNSFKINQKGIECTDNLYRDHIESLIPIDDVFGEIINALRKNEQLDNTIFIFTSDNGYLIGEHRLFGKNKPYEESIRVPLYISGPDIPKQTIDKLVISNDWVPTIADYGGVKLFEGADGMSLKPLIDDPSIKWRKQFLIEGRGFYQVRTEIDSYTTHNKYNATSYYDLVNDPYQLKNKANCTDPSCLERINALENIMKQLIQCSEQQCRDLERQDIRDYS